MFNGCSNLQYINLKNAIETPKEQYKYNNAFKGIPENIVICINETNAPNLTQLIKQKDSSCYNIYCSDDWISHQKKLKKGTNQCINNCNNNNDIYLYEFNGICQENCPHGSFRDENDFVEKCKCENEKCYSCPNVEQVKNLCIICNKSFYPIENDPLNIGPYINCYKDPIGYYLDKIDEKNSIYKLCYDRCKTCKIKGDDINNNCLECNSEYPFGISKNNYLNCYKNCTYYYYFDILGNYKCTINNSCPGEYNKLIIYNRECIKECELDEEYKYEFKNKCYSNCPRESKKSINNNYYCEALCNEEKPFLIIETQECVEFCDINEISKSCLIRYIGEIYEESLQNILNENKEKIMEIKKALEIKAYDKILENFEKGFTSENFDISELENGNDVVTKAEKMIITLTTTDNQKNDDKNDTSTKVDIGPCEDILRSIYNISLDKKLFMKKIDIVQEGMKIPKIEYDIYSKLNGTNLIKLNKSFCSNVKAELSIRIILTENIDKLNISSNYYNDICYTSTTGSGTDIILKDRKNEFINDNKAVCQDGCDFTKYDYNTFKATCSCDIKESPASFASMNINKEKLFENFIDIKNIANINILKCYKILFSKKGIKGNIGFLIIIIIIILHFIFILFLYSKNLDTIKKMIKDIVFGITNWNLIKADEIVKNKKPRKINTKKINIKNNDINHIISNKAKIKSGNKYINPPKKINRRSKMIIINKYFNYINSNNSKYNFMNKSIIQNSKNELSQKQSIIQKTMKIMAYNDEELNQLSYELALKNDNRTYCQYYNSLIQTKHNLIFSFCYKNDYNSRIIKIDLFFINFILDFTLNALFFDDDTMHKIYEDKGKFDFLYQLPQILYSLIISSVLDTLLKLLALSEDYILDLKKDKSCKNLNRRYIYLYKKIKIILFSFCIISSIFLLLFWYYISMFCAIYKNTQIHLIKDTLISFGTSLLYPFVIYLLPGFFRIPALSNKNNKRECFYNLSKFLQMF